MLKRKYASTNTHTHTRAGGLVVVIAVVGKRAESRVGVVCPSICLLRDMPQVLTQQKEPVCVVHGNSKSFIFQDHMPQLPLSKSNNSCSTIKMTTGGKESEEEDVPTDPLMTNLARGDSGAPECPAADEARTGLREAKAAEEDEGARWAGRRVLRREGGGEEREGEDMEGGSNDFWMESCWSIFRRRCWRRRRWRAGCVVVTFQGWNA